MRKSINGLADITETFYAMASLKFLDKPLPNSQKERILVIIQDALQYNGSYCFSEKEADYSETYFTALIYKLIGEEHSAHILEESIEISGLSIENMHKLLLFGEYLSREQIAAYFKKITPIAIEGMNDRTIPIDLLVLILEAADSMGVSLNRDFFDALNGNVTDLQNQMDEVLAQTKGTPSHAELAMIKVVYICLDLLAKHYDRKSVDSVEIASVLEYYEEHMQAVTTKLYPVYWISLVINATGADATVSSQARDLLIEELNKNRDGNRFSLLEGNPATLESTYMALCILEYVEALVLN